MSSWLQAAKVRTQGRCSYRPRLRKGKRKVQGWPLADENCFALQDYGCDVSPASRLLSDWIPRGGGWGIFQSLFPLRLRAALAKLLRRHWPILVGDGIVWRHEGGFHSLSASRCAIKHEHLTVICFACMHVKESKLVKKNLRT